VFSSHIAHGYALIMVFVSDVWKSWF